MPCCAARTIAIAAAIICQALPAAAQFLPQLQAASPEEFDAYLDVMEATVERVPLARHFLTVYPRSDLRLPVYEMWAEACRKEGDADGALKAARSGLAVTPDYIPLLTLLGSVEANRSPRPAAEAGEAAGRALTLLDRAKAPHRIEAGRWLSETARLKAENLATLALIAFKSGNTAEAIRQLEASIAASPAAAQHYRLGLLYAETGRPLEARSQLQRAAADAQLKVMAEAALRKLLKEK